MDTASSVLCIFRLSLTYRRLAAVFFDRERSRPARKLRTPKVLHQLVAEPPYSKVLLSLHVGVSFEVTTTVHLFSQIALLRVLPSPDC
jgi:hypothetical protein